MLTGITIRNTGPEPITITGIKGLPEPG